MNKQRNLVVVSGPSGCGKDSVIQMLQRKYPEIEVSVSATTREPRKGEQNGVEYYFVSKEQFEEYIAKDALLEYANYVGKYYGTLKSEVDRRIENNIVCVLVIEVQGAEKVKKIYPDCTLIFLLPPSMEELEQRLRLRGTDSEESIQKRLQRAREEMEYASNYDYQLVNQDLDECAEEVYEILQKRRNYGKV